MEFTPPGFLKTNLELPFFLRLTAILYFVFTITTAVVKRFWTLRIRVLYKYFDIIILLFMAVVHIWMPDLKKKKHHNNS